MSQNWKQKDNKKYEDNQTEGSIIQPTVVSERNNSENEEITEATKQDKFPEMKRDVNLSV